MVRRALQETAAAAAAEAAAADALVAVEAAHDANQRRLYSMLYVLLAPILIDFLTLSSCILMKMGGFICLVCSPPTLGPVLLD